MDFDTEKGESIKSQMVKSLLSSSPLSSSSLLSSSSSSMRSSMTKSSFKSSKKVVTSSGSKVAVFEAESQSFLASETVGDETKTETSHEAAERYCELENEDAGFSDQFRSLINDEEFGAVLDKPSFALLAQCDDEREDWVNIEEHDPSNSPTELECKFGICPQGKPCRCLDGCEIDEEVEEEESSVFEETDVVANIKNVKIN
eukprot:gene7944-8799_t